MSSFDPGSETCPVCHRKGDCRIHAYYERFVIDFINGKPVCLTIRVLRVICSCGHTHAILPDPIIPYDSYSLFFILRVLIEYHRRSRTIIRLCEKYGITPAMLYRWKKLYQEHRCEWQGLLESIEQDVLSSLKALIRLDPFMDFASLFFQKTGLTFLQSHRNPAYFKRKPDPP